MYSFDAFGWKSAFEQLAVVSHIITHLSSLLSAQFNDDAMTLAIIKYVNSEYMMLEPTKGFNFYFLKNCILAQI